MFTRALTVMALALALAAPAKAADLSGYIVLTTDYVWRGVTQSAGDPAAQLGGDIAFDNGIYAGIWASTVDINKFGVQPRWMKVEAAFNTRGGITEKVTAKHTAAV